MEIWKQVKGFEGLYSISNHGRLKSHKRIKKGYILKNTNKTGWYFNVVLQSKENKKTFKIHRLVAEHFIPNPKNKPQVNHIDGNKQNNHVDNLEWVTAKENILHSIRMNPNATKGMIEYNTRIRPKIIIQYSLCGLEIDRFYNSSDASKATGVCQRNILQVANQAEYKPGKTRKQAGGYIWKFEQE